MLRRWPFVLAVTLTVGAAGCTSCSGDNEVLADADAGALGSGGSDGGDGATGVDIPGGPGTLVLRIPTPDAGADVFDTVHVAGVAKLGGTLQLEFAPSYVATPGQKLVLMTADQGITGTFATIDSPVVHVTPGQDAHNFWVTIDP